MVCVCGLGVADGLPTVVELCACIWSISGCWMRAGVVRMCMWPMWWRCVAEWGLLGVRVLCGWPSEGRWVCVCVCGRVRVVGVLVCLWPNEGCCGVGVYECGWVRVSVLLVWVVEWRSTYACVKWLNCFSSVSLRIAVMVFLLGHGEWLVWIFSCWCSWHDSIYI